LARRKSGKTSFVQRLYKILWSENGQVVPFYFDIGDNKVWYPDFAEEYFCAFASQYISFVERKPEYISTPLTMDKIREYGKNKGISFLVQSIDSMGEKKKDEYYSSMWKIAASAPHRFASVSHRRFLVILDEFQNITAYIYPDKNMKEAPIDTLAGSYHSLAESKVAPMLVTGSYVGWLIDIMDKYLEAGRLSRFFMTPYLTPEAGLEAVFKYADAYHKAITNVTALLLNTLCFSDPFFISCIFQSQVRGRDLTTDEGVVATVNYEISHRQSEMSMTWREYIDKTLQRVNDKNAKKMLLFLTKHSGSFYRPKELKKELNLSIMDLIE
jgi:hypothetical protein